MQGDAGGRVRVLIATPLEDALVERIRSVDGRLEVVYRPDLIGPMRYPADHYAPAVRSPAQEEEWARILAETEVMFDADPPVKPDLPARAPRLKWVQTSGSGVGAWMQGLGLVDSDVVVTNAAGIHAVPLAEFVLLAMLYFAKRIPKVLDDRAARRWDRFALQNLRGKTLGVVGLGAVGPEVARLAGAFGMRVLGAKRSVQGADPRALHVERLYPLAELRALLGESDYVTLILPLTAETTGLIGEAELAAMKPGAVLINIARGAVIDEAALLRALDSGHLAGAALDVFSKEPLPPDSPFWDHPKVLLTPHSMSTAFEENAVLADLFCDNLRRYLAGEPLRNVVDKRRGY
jgi:phosphoglycerate dehydrogenase-like enzyme